MPYIVVILLAFLSGLTTLIGAGLALYFKKSTRFTAVGLGFSTGIMLMISFLELLPEAVAWAGLHSTVLALSFGFLLILSLNFVIPHIHITEEAEGQKRLIKVAYLVTLGLVLHDFPEGFMMANSYIFAPTLGLFVAISIAIHNIPEEFAAAAPIALIKKRGFLIKMALLSALAEPLGAALGLLAVSAAPALNPIFMAFGAGAMIFVSLHELFPLARKYGRIHHFSLGAAAGLLVYLGLAAIF